MIHFVFVGIVALVLPSCGLGDKQNCANSTGLDGELHDRQPVCHAQRHV
jgi:hypothetical protein